MFVIKKLLSALILPPLSLILLALGGLWISRRHPRLGRGVIGLSLTLLVALSLPFVANTLTRSLEQYPPITSEQLACAEAIVILGGGTYSAAPEYGSDTVNRWTLERIRYGIYLQGQTGLPILVSGGAPHGGRPEGENMKEAIERDFKGKIRWAENASLDTADNARYSAKMLKQDGVSRIALVTHSNHMRRATAHFEKQGLEVLPAATGFSVQSASFAQFLPSAGALASSNEALHEWLGILILQLIH
jgi:uncharacterized SAM-binding protein YcdF (DUF218 family)